MNSTENKQKNVETGETLPDQMLQHAHKAMRVLLDAGFDARLAGGCVRDRLLGRRPKDYDIATNALPDQVCAVFKQKSMKVVPTGIDHGTVTLILAGQPLEITTLRRDVATDGRRAVVAFSDSFEEDAGRRDFTINALFEDIDGRVHDYYKGLDDLRAGILRFVGDPIQRVREDYLRILRLFRFWARYTFAPAEGILPILGTEKRGLALISQERKTAELMQTLGEKGIGPVVEAIQTQGIHTELGFDALDSTEIQTLDSLGPAWARLAFLFKGDRDEKTFRRRLSELRLAKAQEEWSVLLFWPGAFPGQDILDQMEFLDALEAGPLANRSLDEEWLSLWEKLGTFSPAELSQLRAAAFHVRRPMKLPIDGRMLIQSLGLKAGPELGESLRLARRAFRNGEWTTSEEGLRWAAAHLNRKES